MFCPKCGARNEASARICRDCGQVMEVTSEEDPFRTRLAIPGAVIPTISNSVVATTPPTSPTASSSASAAPAASTPETAIDPYATITGMDAIDIKAIMEATANQSANASQSASTTGNDPAFDPFSTLKSVPKSQIPLKPSETDIDPFKTLSSGMKPTIRPASDDEINITDSPTATGTIAPIVPDDALATVVGMPAIKIPETPAVVSNVNTANSSASASTAPPTANTSRNMALMYIGIGVVIAVVIMGLLMFLMRG
jgi:hypothetical protein